MDILKVNVENGEYSKKSLKVRPLHNSLVCYSGLDPESRKCVKKTAYLPDLIRDLPV